jgi:protein SCO1
MKIVQIALISLILFSCKKTASDLPFIGQAQANGQQHQVAAFKFTDLEGKTFSEKNVENKVYVADFFFTSCPTICPAMKTQMLRVHEKFKGENNFLILSHSIDPEHDSLSVLKNYKEKLVGNAPNWFFLRADKVYTHTLAQKQYIVTAMEDKNAVSDGGFVHSGAFVLVDQNRHIRGVYDGTKPEEVDKLIKDIPLLLEK